VHRHEQPTVGGLEKELRRTQALLQREEETLAGRPEGEQAVHPTSHEEVHVRRDRVLVEGLAGIPERRQRRRQCSSQHGPTLS
jgi:hypothetical protein